MNKSDLKRDYFMLKGPLAKQGHDWCCSLTAYNKKTGEPKPFFIEYFVCNTALGRMLEQIVNSTHSFTLF